MCGRYIIVDKIETVEKRFNVTVPADEFKENYNISPGQVAPVITDDNPKNLQFFTFGLTPFWAKKQMYLFNARSEGDHNKEDDPNYNGAKGIIEKPAFRKQIRSQRCLVIASGFIEGPKAEGLSKPFLVYLRNQQRPFAMAGIWDTWKDELKGEEIHSFSIITTTANELLQKIGHHRMPVILHPGSEHTWLKANAALAEITRLLHQYPAERMNAYPIDPLIKNPKNNSKELLQPKGERVFPEFETKISRQTGIQGFGHKKHDREPGTWGKDQIENRTTE